MPPRQQLPDQPGPHLARRTRHQNSHGVLLIRQYKGHISSWFQGLDDRSNDWNGTTPTPIRGIGYHPRDLHTREKARSGQMVVDKAYD
jgi:hypothetical protein